MAKRVICECPSCHHEATPLRAVLEAEPLFECPACGATMEVDLSPPPEAPRASRTPVSVAPTSGGERERSSKNVPGKSPVLDVPPPTLSSKQIAKTQPMFVTPSPSAKVPKPKAKAKPQEESGYSAMVVVAVAVLCAAGGWLARGATQRPNMNESVEAYCQTSATGQTAEQMCDAVLPDR